MNSGPDTHTHTHLFVRCLLIQHLLILANSDNWSTLNKWVELVMSAEQQARRMIAAPGLLLVAVAALMSGTSTAQSKQGQ